VPAVARRGKGQVFPGNERPRRFSHLEARQMFEPGTPTLEERVSSLWSGLVSQGSAECLVCAQRMRAAEPCTGCGSELS
jgi:hypothetical protein